MQTHPDPISDPIRLAAVGDIYPGQLGVLEFDRLTTLASDLLGVPTCLVSLVTEDTQDFKGACGLPPAVEEVRSTPLSHSLCKHTVISKQLFIVNDAPNDPRVRDNPIIEEIGLRAYLGFPLVNSAGLVLGAFCLIDYTERRWTDREVDSARDFAAIAVELIEAATKQSRTAAALDVIAHDLRSPLSGISLSSGMLGEHIASIPEKLHGMVESIAASTLSALQLLDTFSEMDHSLDESNCEDPGAVIGSVVSRFEPSAEEKKMKFVMSIEDYGPLAVPDWVIEQTLDNLVSNAIKYAPDGSTVWLSFCCEEERGCYEIRDEGPGFSEKDRRKIFKRYQRLSARPTGNQSSTGIGLSIAKRLCEQNGGTLELVSPPGEGAKFRMTFPRLLGTT